MSAPEGVELDAEGEAAEVLGDDVERSVELVPEAAEETGSPGEDRKRKPCIFLCGSICWRSEDPVGMAVPHFRKRKSIRWAYDKEDFIESNGSGGACWYCDRTFEQEAHTEPDRDRGVFIAELSRNGDTLSKFGVKRKGTVKRTIDKALAKRAKRRGRGRAAGSVWPSDFWLAALRGSSNIRTFGPVGHAAMRAPCSMLHDP